MGSTSRTRKSESEDHSRKEVFGDVRALAKILQQHDLAEVEIETKQARIRVSRSVNGGAQWVTSGVPMGGYMQPVDESGLGSGAAHGNSSAARGGNGAPAKASEAKVDDGTTVITSPFVGTFYESPSPGTPPFVSVGQKVQRGHTLCIVEAMKLMNEIEAELDCTIVEHLAKNGEPVEYGQALFRVKPA